MDENFKKLTESLKITEQSIRYAARYTGNENRFTFRILCRHHTGTDEND